MPLLDYFTVSPGDRARAQLELQNRISLLKAGAATDLERERNIRDSNQLSADVQKHKNERDLQEAIAGLDTTTNPNMTPDQNDTLNLIHASDKMNEIKAAQPLATSAVEMNTAGQALAGRPFNERLGESTATSAISGNEANTSGNFLRNKINKSRFTTAPVAARQADVAGNAELVNAYNEALSKDKTLSGREQATMGESEARHSEALHRAKLAEALNENIGVETEAAKKAAMATSALSDYGRNYNLALNPTSAANAINAKNQAELVAEQELAKNPVLNKLMHIPNINSALMMNPDLLQQIINGLGNTGNTNNVGGGLNPSVGPRTPIGIKIQR